MLEKSAYILLKDQKNYEIFGVSVFSHCAENLEYLKRFHLQL